MEAVQISVENRETFVGLLDEDRTECIGRSCYGGIGVLDHAQNAAGAMLYELLDIESVEDTRGKIGFVRARDAEVLGAMLKEYTDTVVPQEDIAETFYELDNKDDARVLQENGFTLGEGESDTIALTLGELKDHKLAQNRSLPQYIKSMGSLSLVQYRKAVNQILLKGYKGVFEDMAYLPLRWFDTELSSCCVSGDKATGLFLIRRNPSGTLIPALLYAYGPDYRKDLLYLISYSIRRALAVCPPDTPLLISRKNQRTRAVTQKLLPAYAGQRIYVGKRTEKCNCSAC